MTSGRRRLLPWLLAQAQSGRFPGLEFDDAARSALRVPWERAGKGGAGGGAAAALCQAWAEYKGATPPPGPAICKTRLRCALHKCPELQELPERARLDGPRPYKVYRLLGPRPQRHGPAPRRSSKGRKEEAEPRGDDTCCPEPGCALRGSLHGHHPRHCLFYLRDWHPQRLLQILTEAGVSYETEPPPGAQPPPGGGCWVPEQKETPGGLRDEACGREAPPGQAGLCRAHYAEYLVSRINAHALDPTPPSDPAPRP